MIKVTTPKNIDKSSAYPLIILFSENNDLQAILQNKECYIFQYDNVNISDNELIKQIKKLSSDYQIDENRIYIIGNSVTGSNICWKLLENYSRVFAGCIIVDGFGNPYNIRNAKFIPILALSSENKNISQNAQAMIYSLNSIGNSFSSFDKNSNSITIQMINWLFEQSKSNQYEINWIKPGLWNIESGTIDSFYLIEGKQKSLLIDTGMGNLSVINTIKKLTNLPIELALTHAHGDHMLHADEFNKVYISSNENKLSKDFLNKMMPNKNYDLNSFNHIKEGDIISLGEHDIEILNAFGHTPGSLVFVDHKNKCLFCGDAFGSGIGVLMAIPGNLPLSEYKENLIQFLGKTTNIRDYTLYGGHWIQERGFNNDITNYTPLTFSVIEDMVTLCDKILNNDSELSWIPENSNWVDEEVFYISHKTAAMWICKSNIK